MVAQALQMLATANTYRLGEGGAVIDTGKPLQQQTPPSLGSDPQEAQPGPPKPKPKKP